MPTVENFFNNIKKLRGDDKGFVTKLAETSGISRASINDYVNGKGDPSLSSIEKIAAALGVSASSLLGDNVPKVPGPSVDELRILCIISILKIDVDHLPVVRDYLEGLAKGAKASVDNSKRGLS